MPCVGATHGLTPPPSTEYPFLLVNLRTAVVVALLFTTPGLSSCSLRRLTADSTADLLHAGAPQFNTLEDLQFAEEGSPANLVTMESVWRVAPDNEDVLIELVQGYVGYGYAFMEDHMERAQAIDDPTAEEYYRARARAAYHRALRFGFALMDTRQSTPHGPHARARESLAVWHAYLARFTHRDDVPALYWTGMAWVSSIQLSLDDPRALLDLPFAVAVMERAQALDPEFYYGGIHAFWGAYWSSTSPSFGGQPQRAREEFEAAVRDSHREYLTWQVLYARTYAVQTQNRELFESLLREVLSSGDVMPSERLSNQVARRRAARYLAQADELFSTEAPLSAVTPQSAEPTPGRAPAESAPTSGEGR